MQLTTATRNVVGDALGVLPDSGGKIKFYDSGDVLIVECNMAADAFGAAASGVITAGTISQGTAVASGTITYCTTVDSGATEEWRNSVGLSGSGKEFILSNTTLSSGDKLDITSYTVTVPAGTV